MRGKKNGPPKLTDYQFSVSRNRSASVARQVVLAVLPRFANRRSPGSRGNTASLHLREIETRLWGDFFSVQLGFVRAIGDNIAILDTKNVL